jgi:hypothetical protein
VSVDARLALLWLAWAVIALVGALIPSETAFDWALTVLLGTCTLGCAWLSGFAYGDRSATRKKRRDRMTAVPAAAHPTRGDDTRQGGER